MKCVLKAILAITSTLSILSTSQAQSITKIDIDRAFDSHYSNIAILNSDEMNATKGQVTPLVAIGVMTAGRFIVQRWVSQSVARSIVSRGGSVMAANRQQAAALARSAGNGAGPIREFHPGPGSRYTHFHTSTRNGSHVWYGRPR